MFQMCLRGNEHKHHYHQHGKERRGTRQVKLLTKEDLRLESFYHSRRRGVVVAPCDEQFHSMIIDPSTGATSVFSYFIYGLFTRKLREEKSK